MPVPLMPSLLTCRRPERRLYSHAGAPDAVSTHMPAPLTPSKMMRPLRPCRFTCACCHWLLVYDPHEAAKEIRAKGMLGQNMRAVRTSSNPFTRGWTVRRRSSHPVLCSDSDACFQQIPGWGGGREATVGPCRGGTENLVLTG